MLKMALCLSLMCISASIALGADANPLCGDDSWTAYKDEKCVKLFQTFQTRDAAEEICSQQYSTLVSVHSADEQKFLSELILKASEDNSVWIGASRRLDSEGEFYWNDGSPVQRYTNWGIERPSKDTRRACVIMQSEVSRQLSDLQWTDITCSAGNWFTCQKLQSWPLVHFQQAILDARKELQHNVYIFTNQMNEMRKHFEQANLDTSRELQEMKIELKELQDNPIPIGFIYVQLQDQPEPSTLWPTVEWSEITAQYAGLFFRAVGQGSAAFGTIQAENSPRLNEVHVAGMNAIVNTVAVTANGNQSLRVSSGAEGAAANHWGLAFRVSAGEVRPRNTAMRIWMRSR